MTISVSATSTNRKRFSSSQTETSNSTTASPKAPLRKAFARSPYRERTVMLRVPESLVIEFKKRLEQHKRAVAAGNHDNWD
ncbi:MAG: hypothetical protein ACKOF9_11125 [Burkholderiales bacterium]